MGGIGPELLTLRDAVVPVGESFVGAAVQKTNRYDFAWLSNKGDFPERVRELLNKAHENGWLMELLDVLEAEEQAQQAPGLSQAIVRVRAAVRSGGHAPGAGEPVSPARPVEPEPTAEAGGARRTERAFALVVGVGTYEHGRGPGELVGPREFKNLDFAEKDARAVATFLGTYPHIDYDVDLLVNEQADLRHVMRALDGLRARCAQSSLENPLVVLYFSGHAMADADGRHFLVPHDAERDDLFATALWSRTLDGALGFLQARTNRVVVFLDTCHAGAYAEEEVSARDGALLAFDPRRGLSDATRRYLVASCAPTQQSYELDGHGIFTRHLLEVLRCEGGDLDQDALDLRDVYRALKEKVEATARRLGKTQVPFSELDLERPTGITLAINHRRIARRERFLKRLRPWLDQSRAKAKLIIALTQFVESGEKRAGIEDLFYKTFAEAFEDWRPGDEAGRAGAQPSDDEHFRETCRNLIYTYEPKAAGRPVAADDDYRRVEAPSAASHGLVSRAGAAMLGARPIAPPPPSPPPASEPSLAAARPSADERRCLADADRAWVLEVIALEPGYMREHKRLEAALAAPGGVSRGAFTALLRGAERGDDAALGDLLCEIGRRFAERWEDGTPPQLPGGKGLAYRAPAPRARKPDDA